MSDKKIRTVTAMNSEMRRKLAQLPFEEKIRRVGQLIELSREAKMHQKQKLAEILRSDLGVKESYEHAQKHVTPGEVIETNGAVLKWYRLAPQDRQVPDEIDRLARSFLGRQTNLEAKGLGFVILHRCGEDFYFLIVHTWRGNNEVWETLFYKDGDAMADFALWPRDGMHKPTFCVWELAPVWHETKSWERFLMSARDEAAAKIWQQDLYSGAA